MSSQPKITQICDNMKIYARTIITVICIEMGRNVEDIKVNGMYQSFIKIFLWFFCPGDFPAFLESTPRTGFNGLISQVVGTLLVNIKHQHF
jgi:hypothetical protein